MHPSKPPAPPTDSQTIRNIRTICTLEQEALDRRTLGEHIGDFVSLHAGRMWFILFHVAWYILWIVWNSGKIGAPVFDPYPYAALMAVASIEAIFLSLFVLMSQNRSSKRADERSHLDLQINLLAEYETTKILRMLQALCKHHKLAAGDDPELAALIERTEPELLARELESRMPSEGVPGSARQREDSAS